jgi:hypothetical protein
MAGTLREQCAALESIPERGRELREGFEHTLADAFASLIVSWVAASAGLDATPPTG